MAVILYKFNVDLKERVQEENHKKMMNILDQQDPKDAAETIVYTAVADSCMGFGIKNDAEVHIPYIIFKLYAPDGSEISFRDTPIRKVAEKVFRKTRNYEESMRIMDMYMTSWIQKTMEFIVSEGQPAFYPYERSYGENKMMHLNMVSEKGYLYFEKGARVIKQIIKHHFEYNSDDYKDD